MIKRTKRTNRSDSGASTSAGLSDAVLAELNGRPTELAAAPHDPDSPTAWMAEGNCRLHPPSTFFPSDGVGVDVHLGHRSRLRDPSATRKARS